MIKLQDFARECGVTDRAIQKHLNTYAEELEGLYQRKGPNGTWLTDEACEILRSKMRQQPIGVADTSLVNKNAELTEKLLTMHEKLDAMREKMEAQQPILAEYEVTQRLLQASEAENKSMKDELAGVHQELGAARQEIDRLRSMSIFEFIKEKRKSK